MCVQLNIVSRRTVLNLLRNPQTSYAQMALNVLFGVLVGLIYFQMPHTLPEALQNRYTPISPSFHCPSVHQSVLSVRQSVKHPSVRQVNPKAVEQYFRLYIDR